MNASPPRGSAIDADSGFEPSSVPRRTSSTKEVAAELEAADACGSSSSSSESTSTWSTGIAIAIAGGDGPEAGLCGRAFSIGRHRDIRSRRARGEVPVGRSVVRGRVWRRLALPSSHPARASSTSYTRYNIRVVSCGSCLYTFRSWIMAGQSDPGHATHARDRRERASSCERAAQVRPRRRREPTPARRSRFTRRIHSHGATATFRPQLTRCRRRQQCGPSGPRSSA